MLACLHIPSRGSPSARPERSRADFTERKQPMQMSQLTQTAKVLSVVMVALGLAVLVGCSRTAYGDPQKRPDNVPQGAAEAVFAGGCFWCVEAVFEELDGVHEVVSGYAGGDAQTANYEAVSSGDTKHAEAVKIYYDPAKITYQTLLEVHFVTHDPTTLNRQGADIGPQYRSTIFYANAQEQEAATAYIKTLNDAGTLSSPIVTTLEPLTEFYVAETYHQNYVCENPAQGYVKGVALPKVEKVREKFQKRLKAKSPLADTL